MAIMLKEIFGFKIEEAEKYNHSFAPSPEAKNLNEKFEALDQESIDWATGRFRAKIEAIHCYPFSTRNFTRYMPKACKESTKSWLEPYNRPVIMYHNDYDGEITGRVVEAEMAKSTQTDGDCLVLTVTAPGYSTREKVMSGIYHTTSIGVAATDVRCSICGAKLADGETCEHYKGLTYDGETCYWDVYEFDPKEISYVRTPSDPYSQIVEMGKQQEEIANDEGKNVKVGSAYQTQYRMTNTESQGSNIHGIDITESKPNHKEINTNTMDITEAQYNELISAKEALETEKKVLINDKEALNDTIKALNADKLQFQESVKELKQQIAEDKVAAEAVAQLKEALEEENKKLLSEVKQTLVDKLTNMRKTAKLPKIEKLDERSIDMLRMSISDLEADIAARQIIDAKESVQNPTLSNGDNPAAPNSNKTKGEPQEPASSFDL